MADRRHPSEHLADALGAATGSAVHRRRLPRAAVILLLAVTLGGIGVGLTRYGSRLLTTPATSALPPGRGVADLNIDSLLLGRPMRVQVYTPPAFDVARAYPVLYLFHGRGGDERTWFHGGSAGDGVGVDLTADRLIAERRIAP